MIPKRTPRNLRFVVRNIPLQEVIQEIKEQMRWGLAGQSTRIRVKAALMARRGKMRSKNWKKDARALVAPQCR